MQKRRLQMKRPSRPSGAELDEDRRRFHHLHNNFAAIRLWLTFLRETSCAKCHASQAEGLRAIDRNLQDAQASTPGRLRVKAPVLRRSRGPTRKAAR
jgi:hypothetical protein